MWKQTFLLHFDASVRQKLADNFLALALVSIVSARNHHGKFVLKSKSRRHRNLFPLPLVTRYIFFCSVPLLSFDTYGPRSIASSFLHQRVDELGTVFLFIKPDFSEVLGKEEGVSSFGLQPYRCEQFRKTNFAERGIV